MKTTQFQYNLPDQAISKEPSEPRDASKLLVSRYDSECIDSHVRDFADFLDPGDMVVVNNTKVLPARIPVVRQTGGTGEVFLLYRVSKGIWSALVRPSKKIDEGEQVIARRDNGEYAIEIGKDVGQGHRLIRFVDTDEIQVLDSVGQTPLPPYLGDVDIPLERYQTMFAKEDESVAAPTAGLHFTHSVVDSLTKKNIALYEVTLHVGVGTFRPIMTDDIEDHVMHEERYSVSKDIYNEILSAKKRGNKICAVGTTSLRTLESVAKTGELTGSTDLYCYGDYDFKIVDYLFTNFHQPQSSLLVLLDSFIGSRWKKLYEHALESDYRFLSFGDAMLVAKRFEGIRK